MNIIYKLVWNPALGAFMVASEFAAGKGKRRNATASRKRFVAHTFSVVVATLMSASVAHADATKLGTGSNATGSGASNTAIGYNAQATGALWNISSLGNRRLDGLGFGISAATLDASSIALGDTAKAQDGGSMAIGSRAVAASLGALATGVYANALGRNSIAHGSGSHASGTQAISFGTFSVANAARAAAFGTNATATGTDATAIGTSSTASGARAIALGSALTGGSDTTDTKQNITDQTRAGGADAIAVGTSANAVGDNAIAMGRAASVTVKNAVAIGVNASATHEGSVALGSSSTTTANLSAVAYTSKTGAVLAGATAAGEVSVGSATDKRRVTNVAAGAEGSDAVNVSQLQAEASKSNTTAAGIAAAIGGGAVYDADTGTFTAPSMVVGDQTVTSIGDAITNIDGRTSGNTTSIATLNSDLNSGAIGLVRQDAGSKAISVAGDTAGTSVNFAGTDGARALTGVQAGALAADSTEAVNGSQLFTTNTNVTALGGRMDTAEGNITGLDGRMTTAEGDITAINGDIGSLGDRVTTAEGNITTVQGDISTINTNITTMQGDITSLDNRTMLNESSITSLQGDISTITTNINNGSVGLVKQDADSKAISVAGDTAGTSVNFAGTDGARALTGVQAGALAADSTEAVNGSQLFATNSNVTALGGRMDTAEGNITGLDGRMTAAEGDITAINGDIGSLGDRVTATEGNITTVQGDISSISTNITTMQGDIASLDNRTSLNEGSITSLQGDISTITTNINNGSVGLVKQDADSEAITVAAATGGSSVSFAGTSGARILTGVKAGGQALDAVNVAQLQAFAAGIGGGAAVNADGSITGPSYVVTNADGSTTTVASMGDAITHIDDRVADNSTQIGGLTTQLSDGSLGLVKQDAATGDITVAADKAGSSVNFAGSQGARVLDGVANGSVSASSLQAVNGAQLHGVSQSVATHLGGGATVNADGSISAPSYSVGGKTVSTIGDAVANIDGRTTQNANDITELKAGMGDISGSVAGINDRIDSVNNSVGQLDNRVSQLETTIADGSFGAGGMISSNIGDGTEQLALASGEGTLALGNGAVASSKDSTALGNNSQATGNSSVALGNGSLASRDNSVSVGSVGQERQLTNVAAGTEDTDAVNVAQLKQTVRYDQKADGSTDYSHVTLGHQGIPVTMSNVARGRVSADSTDAINGSQLYDWTMNRNNEFSNASLAYRIGELESSMHAGIATAMAARQAPYVAGKVTYSVGTATYKSQGAVGISSRYTAESGRWSLEGGFSKNGDGSGAYVGVSGVLGD
ncbi:YadA family autotransporter adhesin [Stenotrophomonas humi]|nr:ESPR-type extended signal peptide-containing protein [Stenotrophomonas humi]